MQAFGRSGSFDDRRRSPEKVPKRGEFRDPAPRSV
jgi:hypothetical protein